MQNAVSWKLNIRYLKNNIVEMQFGFNNKIKSKLNFNVLVIIKHYISSISFDFYSMTILIATNYQIINFHIKQMDRFSNLNICLTRRVPF